MWFSKGIPNFLPLCTRLADVINGQTGKEAVSMEQQNKLLPYESPD